MAKNPEMPESMAFGLATQQSHALGKTPKGYGTAKGRREAKKKYDEPGKMRKTAADEPGKKRTQEQEQRRRRGLVAGGALTSFNGGDLLQSGASDTAWTNFQKEKAHPGAEDLLEKVRGTSPVPVVDAPSYRGSAYIKGAPNPGFWQDIHREQVSSFHRKSGVKPGAINPSESHILLGQARAPGVLAHEIGHADMDKHLLGRLSQSVALRTLYAHSPVVSGAVGLATGHSNNDKVQNAGLIGMAALPLPTLANEASASIKGYRSLKRLGATPEQLRLARNELLPAFGTYGGHALKGLGVGLAGYGLSSLLRKEKEEPNVQKLGFVDALPTITGLTTGYTPGRNIAGEAAAAVAPKGRVLRSEGLAREAAIVGVPLGGLAAMALARKYKLAPRLGELVAKKFPKGVIADPSAEQELVNLGVPGVSAIMGSLAGGAVTGGAVGGLQRLRGPLRAPPAAEQPEPEVKMGSWLVRITKTAQERAGEKEDDEFGDESEPSQGKLAFNVDMADTSGFNANEYSGVMNPPPVNYRSGIPAWREPQVKTSGPPSEAKAASVIGELGELGAQASESPTAQRKGFSLSRAVTPFVRVADDFIPAIKAHYSNRGEAKEAEAGLTPMSRLSSSQAIGAPKVTTPPGPSIAQIAKPKGYGRPISGATKGNNTI